MLQHTLNGLVSVLFRTATLHLSHFFKMFNLVCIHHSLSDLLSNVCLFVCLFVCVCVCVCVFACLSVSVSLVLCVTFCTS